MDVMIHFAWAQFMDSAYYVPLAAIAFGCVLCIVEAWSVKEKAERKQRRRMEDAAEVLASLLDKQTMLDVLKDRVRKNEGNGHRTDLNEDNF